MTGSKVNGSKFNQLRRFVTVFMVENYVSEDSYLVRYDAVESGSRPFGS